MLTFHFRKGDIINYLSWCFSVLRFDRTYLNSCLVWDVLLFDLSLLHSNFVKALVKVVRRRPTHTGRLSLIPGWHTKSATILRQKHCADYLMLVGLATQPR